MRFYPDGWGVYRRHFNPPKHTVVETAHPEDRTQTHHVACTDQTLRAEDYLFFVLYSDA